MGCMLRWGWVSWRWAAAVTACFVILLSVGVALDARGLGTAANLVQVLSVISLIGVIVAWGRARQGLRGQMLTKQLGLPRLLRDIAEAHAKSIPEIKEALDKWDVDAVLNGTMQPGWDFVTAFLDVISGGDEDIRTALERFVRPVWKAARDQKGDSGAAEVATVLVQVTAKSGRLLAINQQTAEASRAAGYLQESVAGLASWRAALVFTLGKYAKAIQMLIAERDELATRLATQQNRARERESGYAAEAALMADELHDVRNRLDLAQHQRAEISQRLVAAEDQLRAAEALRDSALAETARFRQKLARLEHRSAPANSAIVAPTSSDPYRIMGNVDQGLGEEILRRADDFLRQQDAVLSRHAATLSRLRRAMALSRHSRMRAIAAFTTALAVASLGVLVISRGGVGSGSPVTQFPTAKTSLHPAPFTRTDPRLIAILATHKEDAVNSLAFSPDGKTLAVGDQNGLTYLWSPASHKITGVLTNSDAVESVAFNPNGTALATTGSLVYIWNVASRKLMATINPPLIGGLPGFGVVTAFSANGTLLAIGNNYGNISLWNLATSKFTGTLTDPGGSANPSNIWAFPSFGSNGTFPSASSTGTFSTPTVNSLASRPGGNTLAVADGTGHIYLWDLGARRITATLTDPGKNSNIGSIAFNRNGTILAATDNYGNVYLWDLATRKISITLTEPGEKSEVNSIAFNSSGTILAGGGALGDTYLWNLATRKVITTLTDSGNDPNVSSVAFSPSGTLAIADNYGNTYLWDLAHYP